MFDFKDVVTLDTIPGNARRAQIIGTQLVQMDLHSPSSFKPDIVYSHLYFNSSILELQTESRESAWHECEKRKRGGNRRSEAIKIFLGSPDFSISSLCATPSSFPHPLSVTVLFSTWCSLSR